MGAGLLLVVATGRAATPATDSLSGLLQNSPFGTPATTTATPEAAKALEFRGVFVDRGEAFFSLYDSSTRVSRWVGLKEEGNPFVVRSYDAAKGEVQVDYQGRTLTLGLKQARVVASVAPPVPAAGPAPPPAAAGVTPALAAGSQPDEAVRLAQIAEEIRRRRALRQQTLQAQPPGQTAPPK
jgi:hypothetical protein